MEIKRLINDAIRIAINSVNPYNLVKNCVKIENEKLYVNQKCYNLNQFEKIYIFSIGKASFPMAEAIYDILNEKISKGIILTKYGYKKERKLKNFEIIEAGHPILDENSIIGAKKIVKLAENSDDKTLIINLISGGGSSLFELPEFDLKLNELKKVNDVLLKSGMDINEINTVRKFLSKVKGGKFAKICYPAKVISLIISDVVGDRIDTISSGPTYPDNSDIREVYKKYEKIFIKNFPERIIKILQNFKTTNLDEKYFENVENLIIGNNFIALKTLKDFFSKNGFNLFILTSHLKGEAKEVAKIFSAIGIEILKGNSEWKKPFCLISGGETEVYVKGSGVGGRNSELVLSFLISISEYSYLLNNNLYFASFGTDGTDGPTDSAGALFSCDLLRKIKEKNLDPIKFLENNDSYTFFKNLNALIKTGPTNTNVCDVQILIIL